MMYLKKNREVIKELGKNMPAKKLLSQLLIQMFLTYEENKMFRYNVSYQTRFFLLTVFRSISIENINLLINKKA